MLPEVLFWIDLLWVFFVFLVLNVSDNSREASQLSIEATKMPLHCLLFSFLFKSFLDKKSFSVEDLLRKS